jgi:hypothetical protein
MATPVVTSLGTEKSGVVSTPEIDFLSVGVRYVRGVGMLCLLSQMDRLTIHDQLEIRPPELRPAPGCLRVRLAHLHNLNYGHVTDVRIDCNRVLGNGRLMVAFHHRVLALRVSGTGMIYGLCDDGLERMVPLHAPQAGGVSGTPPNIDLFMLRGISPPPPTTSPIEY